MLTKKWRCLAVAVWLVSFAPAVMAARFNGDGAESGGQPVWVVSQINIKKRMISINDVKYRLASVVKVHTSGNKSISLQDLYIGAKVGFRLTDDGRGQSVISEIWKDD